MLGKMLGKGDGGHSAGQGGGRGGLSKISQRLTNVYKDVMILLTMSVLIIQHEQRVDGCN